MELRRIQNKRLDVTLSRIHVRKNGYAKFVLAAAIYAGFTVNLLWWRFESFDRWQWLLPLNVCLAASGCYVLTRRWVSSFAGSLLAGAIYGFGPFMLGLAKFHPTAGFLAASIPWLFCPAAFGHKTKWRRNAGLLVILPLLAIVLFFQLSTHYRFFPVSIQARLRSDDLVSLFAPLVIAERDPIGTTLVGFYHVPIAALIMGCAMLLAARRFHIIAIFALGLVLACWKPVFGVSPVMWLTLPVLCCSVVIGAGIQGLILAGPADRRWLLAGSFVQAGFAIAALLLATKYFQVFLSLADKYARLFIQTAEMYVLGAVAMMILFFVARAGSPHNLGKARKRGYSGRGMFAMMLRCMDSRAGGGVGRFLSIQECERRQIWNGRQEENS